MGMTMYLYINCSQQLMNCTCCIQGVQWISALKYDQLANIPFCLYASLRPCQHLHNDASCTYLLVMWLNCVHVNNRRFLPHDFMQNFLSVKNIGHVNISRILYLCQVRISQATLLLEFWICLTVDFTEMVVA